MPARRLIAPVASVTSRIPISVWAVIAPLYDPVRLAEDLSVLDHISAGRVSYTFGIGYRPAEYALHSRQWRGRGARLEAQFTTMLAAWRGEPVGDPVDDPAARAAVLVDQLAALAPWLEACCRKLAPTTGDGTTALDGLDSADDPTPLLAFTVNV